MPLSNTYVLAQTPAGQPFSQSTTIPMIRGSLSKGLWLVRWSLDPQQGWQEEGSTLPAKAVQPWGASLEIRESPIDECFAITVARRVNFGRGGALFLAGEMQVDLQFPNILIPDCDALVSGGNMPIRGAFPRYSVWAIPCDSMGGQSPLLVQSHLLNAVPTGQSLDLGIPSGARSFLVMAPNAAATWTAIAVTWNGAGTEVELDRWSGGSFVTNRIRHNLPPETAFLRVTASANLLNVTTVFYGDETT